MGWFQDTLDKFRGKTAAKSAADRVGQAGQRYVSDLDQARLAQSGAYDTALGNFGEYNPMQAYTERVMGGVDQAALLEQAQSSPLYQAQLGQIGQAGQAAEEAALRNASATGGLRGGQSIGAITDIATQQKLAESQALSDAYGQQYQMDLTNLGMLGGLGQQYQNLGLQQGLGNSQFLTDIAGARHGSSLGKEQTYQSGRQAGMSNLMGGLGLATGGLNLYNQWGK